MTRLNYHEFSELIGTLVDLLDEEDISEIQRALAEDMDEDDEEFTLFRTTLVAVLENNYLEDEEEELDDDDSDRWLDDELEEDDAEC